MARTVSSKELVSRTARRSLPIGLRIWLRLSPGRTLGYRKGSKGGVWLARYYDAGFRLEEKLGLADDIIDAEGADWSVLSASPLAEESEQMPTASRAL